MKWKYILKRILIAIPTFFGITILAYFILNMAPGSPLDALLADPGITPAELERKRVALTSVTSVRKSKSTRRSRAI